MISVLPKITIVTPSFNQGEYIEQTIASVLDQDYENLEYIIIDGGSTDNSLEIIQKYAKHITYWVSEKDRGQSHAINKGLRKANGEVFNWLNSDDYYTPGTLKVVGETFRDPDVQTVCGKITFLYPDGSTAVSSPFPHSKELREVISSTKFLQPSTFFRTKFFRDQGGVDELLDYCMDYDIWLKYLLKYGLDHTRIIDQVMVNFRFHENSKSVAFRRCFYYDLVKLFIGLENESRTAVHPAISYQEFQQAVQMFYFDTLISAYGLRDFKLFDLALSRIQDTSLSDVKRSELKKMRLRRQWIPSFLFK